MPLDVVKPLARYSLWNIHLYSAKFERDLSIMAFATLKTEEQIDKRFCIKHLRLSDGLVCLIAAAVKTLCAPSVLPQFEYGDPGFFHCLSTEMDKVEWG